VSPNTIISVLKKRNIHLRCAARKLLLTPQHANLSLEFAFHFTNAPEAIGKMQFLLTKKPLGNVKIHLFIIYNLNLIANSC
jgi:hypothetical protein